MPGNYDAGRESAEKLRSMISMHVHDFAREIESERRHAQKLFASIMRV